MDIRFWSSARTRCTPRRWCDDHPHEPWSKLYRVVEGQAVYAVATSDGGMHEVVLKPGSIHLIPGERRHLHSCRADFLLDWCHFTTQDGDLGARLAALPGITSWPFEAVTAADGREAIIATAAGEPHERLRAAGLVLGLLARLPDPPADAGADADLRRRLAPALWTMEYRFREALTVAELARHADLRPSRFQELFRRLYGSGVYAHMVRLRVAEAQRLLTTTDLPVQEVAEATGYGNPFHFSRIFTRHVGQSPSDYRQRGRR